jgi:hypothetical protein
MWPDSRVPAIASTSPDSWLGTQPASKAYQSEVAIPANSAERLTESPSSWRRRRTLLASSMAISTRSAADTVGYFGADTENMLIYSLSPKQLPRQEESDDLNYLS